MPFDKETQEELDARYLASGSSRGEMLVTFIPLLRAVVSPRGSMGMTEADMNARSLVHPQQMANAKRVAHAHPDAFKLFITELLLTMNQLCPPGVSDVPSDEVETESSSPPAGGEDPEDVAKRLARLRALREQ